MMQMCILLERLFQDQWIDLAALAAPIIPLPPLAPLGAGISIPWRPAESSLAWLTSGIPLHLPVHSTSPSLPVTHFPSELPSCATKQHPFSPPFLVSLPRQKIPSSQAYHHFSLSQSYIFVHRLHGIKKICRSSSDQMIASPR